MLLLMPYCESYCYQLRECSLTEQRTTVQSKMVSMHLEKPIKCTPCCFSSVVFRTVPVLVRLISPFQGRLSHTSTFYSSFWWCQHLYKRSTFFASDLSSSGLCHVALLFTNEEQRKTGSWCIWCFCHKCCPCSWHHDDTDCWAQNGNAHTSHSCIFTTFKENIGETPERPGGAHYGLFRVHRYHLKLNSKPQICNKQDH